MPHEIICYHCQQAVEKFLKGFLVLQGEQITKTDDLTLLNEKCSSFDKDFKTVADECLMLTDYAVKVRYPFPLELYGGTSVGCSHSPGLFV